MLRVCSLGFLSAASSDADEEEAAPAAGIVDGIVALPLAGRPLRPIAEDEDEDDDEELAEDELSDDVELLPSLLSLLSLDFDFVSESLELLDDESRFLCVASTFAMDAVVLIIRPDDTELLPVALGNEWRLVFDFDLVLHCGLRGGIGVQGRLVLAATTAAASCAARTASISESGAL